VRPDTTSPTAKLGLFDARSDPRCGAGRRALMEDGDHWPMKEWSLTPSEMTPRRMSPVPPQQSSELSGNDPQVNAYTPLLTKREVTV
jgi:hypothetical protein